MNDEIMRRLEEAREEHKELKKLVMEIDNKVDNIRAEDMPEIKVDMEKMRGELQIDMEKMGTDLKKDISNMHGKFQAASFLIPLVISIAVNFLAC